MASYISAALRPTFILTNPSQLAASPEATMVAAGQLSPLDQQYLSQDGDHWLQQGLSYFQEGRFTPALALIQQSLQAYKRLGDRPLVARVLLTQAVMHYRLGDYLCAVDYGAQCLTVAQELGNLPLVQEVLDHLGNSYRHQGNFSQALEYMNRSLALARQLQDQYAEVRSLNNLAMVYRARGENHQAAAIYQASLEIAQELEEPTIQMQILQNLGNTYKSLQHYNQAIRCYEAFLDLHQRQPSEALDQTALRRILTHLTTVTLAVHDYSRAIIHLQHHLTIVCALGDSRCTSNLLDTLRQCYTGLNQVRSFQLPLETA
ncbi:MAG: tetratricopeptide repeat protein [Cyanobacteriota bacterium]|jgi:tetratricopeptide (TPR) repeat protein|nr:tetratricopeptide repeat protein [Cyanobacteriota bacterium]